MQHLREVVACVVLVGAIATGCSRTTEDEPTINVPSPTAPVATPHAGTDRIGGSVSADLTRAPRVVLPKTPAPKRLLTKDIVPGSGAVAGPDSTVTVRYVAYIYATGREFHSTWRERSSESFSLVGYVVGFAEGVAGMRVGGRREIVVPPSLAYGSARSGPVGPNQTLVFVVDLLNVS